MLQPIQRGGLLIPELGLWMDPSRSKACALVSHAHGDHVARHQSFLATPQTIDLIRVRMGNTLANRGTAVPFGKLHACQGYRLRFYPAGHVLGSAMIHVETDAGDTLLYTGDFKTRPGLAAEPIAIPKADTLVMETTFGRPEYVFPPSAETHRRINDFCRETLESGQTPVLLAYSLGKAQEVLKILERQGHTLMVHKTIRELNQVYTHHGVEMPETRPLDFLNLQGCAVVMPPSVLKQLPKDTVRTAMVSGWGLNESARYRYGVDEVIPLSDHADYSELLDFVERVSPKSVYTVHGYDRDFAADLRRRGYDAWSLSGTDQLELF